jgi:hypothetical protein
MQWTGGKMTQSARKVKPEILKSELSNAESRWRIPPFKTAAMIYSAP